MDTQTADIFAESGVRLRQFSPPTGGLVDLSLGLSKGEGEQSKVDDVREVLTDDSFLRPLN